jgi:hypothetical protein
MIYAVRVGAVHSYGLLDGYYFLPFLPHVLGHAGERVTMTIDGRQERKLMRADYSVHQHCTVKHPRSIS